ncbi:prion-inhibition and propagation-domain-containing protein [Sphaerosporella brunnea]|uniref:Prion-inhibition and propagation-domain-containing protein n=1 Tax=Sphaerosporella brunnea TaxID=1250544 RepID=A0A5J5EWJ8_9PEZI|nr:prion-inhibition and propagation-domain-containing protein [Sphaerosporella brunnea]
MEFAIGTVLSGGSLLIGFKGAIDSYQLISNIAKARPQSDSLVTKAAIEKQRLASWGEYNGISGTSNNNQPPVYDDSVKKLLLRTLASVENTLTDMDQLVNRYGLQPVALDLGQNPAADSQLYPKSTLVEALAKTMKSGGSKTLKRDKIKWAVNDNAKFENLCAQLKYWNDSLYEIVKPPHQALIERVLSTHISSAAVSPGRFSHRNQYLASFSALSQLKHRMRQDPQSPVLEVKTTELTIENTQTVVATVGASSRSIGAYQSLIPVVIEWKAIDNAKNHQASVERVKKVVSRLAVSKDPDFRTLECFGLVDDGTRKRRLGFVHRLPAPDVESDKLPTPLSELLTMAKTGNVHMPPLGARYRLAKALSMALLLIQTSDIHHRSIHADNILFFRKQAASGTLPISDPFLSGFGFAKLADDQQNLDEPDEKYVHRRPEYIPACTPYTKLDDIYGLGVVLFEIATWKPVEHWKKPGMSARQFRDELIKNLPELGGLVGGIYQQAVHRCLTGDFGLQSANADGEELERAFWSSVVKELEMCNA